MGYNSFSTKLFFVWTLALALFFQHLPMAFSEQPPPFEPLSEFSFDEAVSALEKHPGLKAIEYKAESIKEDGMAKSRLEDPVLRIDASNFPRDDIRMGKSPTTGVQLTLSQKIPLTFRYWSIKRAFDEREKSVSNEKETLRRRLILNIWKNAISREKALKNIDVYQENMAWLNDMIQFSGQRYMVGKMGQHDIFNLKIKNSEIESLLVAARQTLNILNAELSETLSMSAPVLDIDTVPWSFIENHSIEPAQGNSQEAAFERRFKSAMYFHDAKKSEKTPDMMLGFSYRYRDDFDPNGDFIGAFISIPIPIFGRRSSSYRSALKNYKEKENQLIFFRKSLAANLERLGHEIGKYAAELTILGEKTMEFAQNARDILEKRYRVGTSSYLELLNSVLQLQNLKLKKTGLEAKIKMMKAQYLFENGASMIPERLAK